MASPNQVPTLCAGDRLTRDEFERRYSAMPDLKKAELIEGVVYMPSPVRHVQHGHPHSVLTGWLVQYSAATAGTQCSTDATLRLDQDNEPQPDLLLRVATPAASSRVDREGYILGAPELVVEVTASSVSYDLHQKLDVYRRCGVREYVVYRSLDQGVDWFALRAGVYERLVADAHGMLRSEVFPGLWLDVPALLRVDARALLAAVTSGTASSEHAAFCRTLA